MPEVLIYFDATIIAPDGSRWTPRACGGRADDGLWDGWIDFVSIDESAEMLRSPRETEQPNLTDLQYWATGLTQVYLEGALSRAIDKARSAPRARQPDVAP